ncbi:sigma-54-dependent transcriptional regulator [Nitrincola tapanii]|uniref:Sigma-54-dependent Fis family transcriptional regulator n=1 Tax=Nitrincola tapanii TaxID=1708751 RepID=A0A5A9W7A7_9GAMM|nr:sigma-54 dependent transcriptional regulator [Nitrincola tapanii]KAA0876602.1 sigma-54-dependent Fis family transcriptional regulator [Nitrincola tapanii]
MAQVLIVEDDQDLREALCDTLSLAAIDWLDAADAETALCLLEKQSVDMVVSDVNMPGMDGHALLGHLRQLYPGMPVALITAYGQVHKAVEAIQQGAVDYLMKPFEPQQLVALVKRHTQGLMGEVDQAAPIAEAPASRQLLQLARRVAQTDSTVLITGESGTGKEVLARYIHQHSCRAQAPFIAINCAAIPENMLEATLFGHEKGAFTGALQAVPGKFEQANGGTLLLDEISEMDVGLQAKLLRVLQEQEVERIGGRRLIQLDVRVLATSNRDLVEAVKQQRFREDLYYRLNVFPLQWPALRERREDILPLAQRLLLTHASKMKRAAPHFSDQARACLQAYDWPGNVRELDNVVQRALILQTGSEIQLADLHLSSLALDLSCEREAQAPMPSKTVEDEVLIQGAGNLLDQDLRQHEYQLILDVLRSCRGSRKTAAEQLGISPRTLRYKLARMREEGIDLDRLLEGK